MKTYNLEILDANLGHLRFTFTDPDFYVVVTNITFSEESDGDIDIEYNAEEELKGEKLEYLENAVADFVARSLTDSVEGDVDGAE